MDKAPRNSKPFSSFTFWVSKSVKFMKNRAKSTNGTSSNRFIFDGMLMNNSLYCASPNCLEAKIEGFVNDNEVIGGKREGFNENEGKIGNFMGLSEEESGESSSGSNFLVSEVTLNDENNSIGDSSSQFSIGKGPYCDSSEVSEENERSHFNNGKLEKQGSYLSEIEMMKERFSKLLLGEDMSGCGNGVCTALALSNAITNLFATIFGQIWKLEPLPYEKKIMWRREVDWLLSVSDHIVELIPSCQTLPDGNKLEVMTSRPRLNLYINLPALRKLENMLLEILESFESSEFWYVDQGVVASEADGSSTFKKPLPRQEDKWWLPVPRVPPGGLSEDARKLLQYRRDCTNQILKAAMAINSVSLAEMDIPDSYLESLPKSGKASLGDIIHRHINSDQFSPECLLECLDVSSEHQALEIADRVEATIYVWRRRTSSKPPLLGKNRSNSRSSWGMVKDLVKDAVKRELLADRAENLLVCLKQRFPGLPQTTLDTSKIQYNKDVGKSILESYSRVLESLSFNIVARIDDLLYVDDLSKHSDHPVTISKVGTLAHKNTGIAFPFLTTPYKTAFTTPIFLPSQVTSPANMDKSPYIESSKLSLGVFGVKRILTDYLSIDGKGKDLYNNIGRSDSSVSMILASPSMEFSGCSREGSGRVIDETDEDA